MKHELEWWRRRESNSGLVQEHGGNPRNAGSTPSTESGQFPGDSAIVPRNVPPGTLSGGSRLPGNDERAPGDGPGSDHTGAASQRAGGVAEAVGLPVPLDFPALCRRCGGNRQVLRAFLDGTSVVPRYGYVPCPECAPDRTGRQP